LLKKNPKKMDTELTVLRKKPVKASALRTEQAVNTARRQGASIETNVKFGAGQNKHQGAGMNSAKLDRETEELKHDKVPLEVGKLIAQGRQAKGLSQKDLATKICEKPQIVGDYEAGRGIPNQQVLAKIERAIGLKLRGKDKGQPLLPPGKK